MAKKRQTQKKRYTFSIPLGENRKKVMAFQRHPATEVGRQSGPRLKNLGFFGLQ